MTRTELPWLFYGRRIRPYALAVSLAAASTAWVILSGRPTHSVLDQQSGTVLIGTMALIGAGLLWAGFWADRDEIMQHGLVITAGVFAARATIILLADGPTQPGLLSACWALASGGAYLLEATTGAPRPRTGG